MNPVGYRAVNILIHFLSALLVWSIVHRALRLPYFASRYEYSAGWLALAIAMLWALHPLQTETVIYATQRTELMFAFCYLASLYCSLRYFEYSDISGERERPGTRRSRILWLALATLSSLAGMACKEVMVSAPLMVLLFERTFVVGSLSKALRRSWPLYVGLFSTCALLIALNIGAPRSESAGFHLGVTAWSWWLTQSKVLWMYLKLVVWPSPLLIHYQLPYLTSFSESWMYVVPTILLVLATLVLLYRNTALGYLGTWFFAILSPTLLVPIILETAAERRMYLPLLAIVVAFVIGVYRLTQASAVDRKHHNSFGVGPSRSAYFVVTVTLAIVFAVISARRAAAYQDVIGLWRDVLHHYPQNETASANMQTLLVKSGQLPEAVEFLQGMLRENPDSTLLLNNLGVAYMHLGRYPESKQTLLRALDLKPTDIHTHVNLGVLSTRMGELPTAIDRFQAALATDAHNVDALSGLGIALILSNRNPEAIDVLERAIQLAPVQAELHKNLGNALLHSSKVEPAIEQYRIALELDPQQFETHFNMGLALGHTGADDEAISHLQSAVRLNATSVDALSNLAAIQRKAGRSQEAIESYEAALRLNPNFLQALYGLAQSLALANRPAEAIAAAEKAIALARSQQQEAAAGQIEDWLSHYRTELRRSEPNNAPSPLGRGPG